MIGEYFYKNDDSCCKSHEKKIDENFRDMKNDFVKIGGNVKFIMGLLKGLNQEPKKDGKK